MNWRILGPCPYSQWFAVISYAGGPPLLSSRDAYDAASEHAALCLAQLRWESVYGTQGVATSGGHNPLGLRPKGGGDGFATFATWADAIRNWHERITDSSYAYAPTVTLAEYIHIYSPDSDNAPGTEASYVASILSSLNEWGISPKETPVPTQQAVVFGRVPKPPIIELICPKPYEGAGFYRVAPRQNVGVCEHITDGHGSIEFYHSFFSTGGERATDALVDFIIGRDGRIGMLNDWRGTRAPWANGNKLGMEGDGPAFYQRFGAEGIDQKLVSIEHEGRADEDWTGPQWLASVNLDAWLFDQMGVRYDSFPVHQDYGVVTHLFHSEFTNKGGNALDECPGRYIKQRVTAYQADIRAVMMAHQVVAANEPKPPPDAPKPPIDISPRPFTNFIHGRDTGTDQHVGKIEYEYMDRRWVVMQGSTAVKRSAPDDTLPVLERRTGGQQVRSAFLVRLPSVKRPEIELDWLIDRDGYAWQYNVFDEQIPLPIPDRTKRTKKAS